MRGLAGVDHRAAAHRDVAVEAALAGEGGGGEERAVGGLDLDVVVDGDVEPRGGERPGAAVSTGGKARDACGR